MRAKSVRQLLEIAAHVERWQSGIGWIAISYNVYRYSLGTLHKAIKNGKYRIVTVKGKAIA